MKLTQTSEHYHQVTIFYLFAFYNSQSQNWNYLLQKTFQKVFFAAIRRIWVMTWLNIDPGSTFII